MEGLSGLSGLVGPLLYNETMRPHLWVSYILALILYSLALVPTLYLTRDDNLGMDNEARDDEIPEETEPLLSAGNHSAREVILSNRSGERSLAPRLNIFIICFACFFGFHLARGSISYTFVWVWLSFGHDAIFVCFKPIATLRYLLRLHRPKYSLTYELLCSSSFYSSSSRLPVHDWTRPGELQREILFFPQLG
jgi:hypothetical protein